MLKTKNVSIFSKDFDIIHYGELPPPDNASYLEMTEKYHLRGSMSEWSNKFPTNNENGNTGTGGE